jgi:GDP-D-mannose 3', 5'-epimerase
LTAREKLFMEKLCQYFREDCELLTRLLRFHNVYRPLRSCGGGYEKAPAAICGKIARSKTGEAIEIWGSGKQTRSFMSIDDCVEGIFDTYCRSEYSTNPQYPPHEQICCHSRP